MEERRTINAPLRLSTAFMCVSQGSRAAHLRVSGHVSNVAIDANRHAKIHAFPRFRGKSIYMRYIYMEVQSVSEFSKIWKRNENTFAKYSKEFEREKKKTRV